MRLPVVDGNDAQIDEAEAARMVSYAMEHGINYYDTAWGYHDGNSETAMGKILAAYPRDSYFPFNAILLSEFAYSSGKSVEINIFSDVSAIS